MKCNGFKNLLPLALENQLRGRLNEDFHAHRNGCPACGREFEMVRSAEKRISVMRLNVPKLSETFEARVMQKINVSPSGNHLYYFSVGFLALSALSFLVVCGLLLFPGTEGGSLYLFKSLYGLAVGVACLTDFPLSNIAVIVFGVITWGVALAYAFKVWRSSVIERV